MKRKHWLGILWLLALLLLLGGCRKAEGEDPALPMDLPLEAEENGLPRDWEISVYGEDYEAVCEDGVLRLTLEEGDDLRLTHLVQVSPENRYILSALIRTQNVEEGRGATLSIDNYSLDKSCVYSESLYGDNDWTPVFLYFETQAGQTQVNLALRLGGYSENSTGTAWFREVRLEQGSGAEGEYQPLSPWGGGQESQEQQEWSEQTYKSLFAALLWAAVLTGIVLLFCVFRNRERWEALDPQESACKRTFGWILLLGLLLRLVLCLVFKGHDTDMSCFITWGQSIAREGTSTFYTAAGHEWYDYPPAYMLFLGGWSALWNLLGVDVYSSFGKFLYMLPAIAADAGCALLLMRFSREQGATRGKALLLGSLVYLNPALFFLSGAWGQIDSILTFFLLLSFMLLQKERRALSGCVFGLAVAIKWQALMFGPVYGLFHLLMLAPFEKKDVWKKLTGTLLGALGALGVLLVISLPFKGEQDLFWLVNRFLSASSGYDYASVEAYNYMALVGGNWKPAGEGLLGSALTYKQFGTACILLGVLLGAALGLKKNRDLLKQGRSLAEEKGALYLIAALVMALIFTFGHYMHERYVVPVLVLLLFAYAAYGDKRLLAVMALFTCTTFLNEMTAMYVVSKAAMSIVRGSVEHTATLRLCALCEVGVCVYFVYLTLDVLFHIRPEKKEIPFYESRDWNRKLEEALQK